MDGLAQQMAGPAAGVGQAMPTVEEIIQMLIEGANPQQLLDMGVPEELLMQALQILEQQMQQQQPAAQQSQPMSEAGLAQTMAM